MTQKNSSENENKLDWNELAEKLENVYQSYDLQHILEEDNEFHYLKNDIIATIRELI